MDASYKIQRGIHVHLIQFFMCPEFWVHINFGTSVESCSEKLRRSPAPVLSANKTFQKGFATRYSGLS